MQDEEQYAGTYVVEQDDNLRRTLFRSDDNLHYGHQRKNGFMRIIVVR